MLRPSSVQLARSTVPVRLVLLATLLLLLASLLPAAAATPFGARTALAGHTPTPASVNLVGSLQSEASDGACGDWNPACAGSAFTAQGNGVYLFESATIPAGDWEYKVAMGDWAENYGANFLFNGPNIVRNLAADQTVRFYYDHKTHYIADNVGNTIYTRPGSFNERARLRRRLGARLPPDLMLRRGRRRRVHVRDDGHPGRELRVQGRDERELEQPELRRGGGGREQRRVQRRPARQHRHDLVQHGDQRSHGRSRGRRAGARQQRRVGRPPPRLARHALPDARRRGRGRHARQAPVPHVPRRRHRGEAPRLLRRRRRPEDRRDDAASPRTSRATRRTSRTRPATSGRRPCANDDPDNIWYRFIVTDGTDTDYYGDDTAALDGGLGATTDDAVDRSWALTVAEPGFTAPTGRRPR